MLEKFSSGIPAESVAKLRFVYAQTLLDLDRAADAQIWFQKTIDLDPENITGAKEYLVINGSN